MYRFHTPWRYGRHSLAKAMEQATERGHWLVLVTNLDRGGHRTACRLCRGGIVEQDGKVLCDELRDRCPGRRRR